MAPGLLTFTTTDWNIARTVTVTGVFDLVTDGNVAYSIVLAAATSADPAYNGLDPADVSVVNLDGVNNAPINLVPGPQTTAQDTALVFSTANGNAISVGDADAGSNPVAGHAHRQPGHAHARHAPPGWPSPAVTARAMLP